MSILRKILLPFSLLYGFIIWLRNIFYDSRVFKSRSFALPVICVGNLSVGGTGKTPMIEYLLRLLLPQYRIATLSRGYGRNSKAYILLKDDDEASRVGDEPLQFKLKFPEAFIAVDENRERGISTLLSQVSPDVVLLDDAFQHRKVKAGLNILLTSYDNIYYKDFILPAGNLREPVTGAKRAQIIVVTKCPPTLGADKQERIRKKLKLRDYQHLYFSYIAYAGVLVNNLGEFPIQQFSGKEIGLVTGIANPQPFINYVEQEGLKFTHFNFPDHHIFTSNELSLFKDLEVIITTEKDYMRLKDVLKHPNLYFIPIESKFINNETEFRQQIQQYVVNEI
ncbi:tetraacyldisaccharide 4'-kinase [Antarcticibacterium arcticum]|uniref:Tetraacyldisaccharide 4'-kinase n=1 Tax=Antarcticibacterium arcticum TaxID=2585771 RepID=A0A5B8YKQ1_9FLAO|nr:tetraacyldisaccharide 4'-kinase [Antarcticibacterium arcticum]QED36279.1 tetraacyldisaccharide 4'-kinase [Antarcticibacterium arcticum]